MSFLSDHWNCECYTELRATLQERQKLCFHAENEETDCAANHLHDIQVTVLYVCVVLKELDPLDNYRVCG